MKYSNLFFSTLVLFLILNINQKSLAFDEGLACVDTTCNAPYQLDSLMSYETSLCDSCHYKIYYYWRICDNPLRIDFQLNSGTVGHGLFDPYLCSGCDWKELWKEGVRKLILNLIELHGDSLSSNIVTFSNQACWKKIDGAGPAGVGGYIVEPCNTECCKYTYQILNGVVHLVQYEAPMAVCPPLEDCFPMCDPFGYFPINKQAIYEDDNSMEIYPNPVTSNLQIKFSNDEAGNYEVLINDLDGLTVLYKEQKHSNGDITFNIDVSKLYRGAYYFVVKFNNNIFKKGKFIVK